MPSAKRIPRKRNKPQPQAPSASQTLGSYLTDTFVPLSAGGRLALLGILVTALTLRVYRIIDLFPPLGDESIYMRWAEIIDTQGQWLISLLDGKPPLSYWVLATLRMVHEADPLLQARLVSVTLGVVSTLLVFALARQLADESNADRAGLFAATLYALLPWAILYDRIGYTEAFVNFFGLVIALTAISVYKRGIVCWRGTLAIGLTLGLALFTKQTAILFVLIPLAAAVFYSGEKLKQRLPNLALAYLIGASFLGANFLLTPEAPTLAGQDAVLHQTGFFADPAELLRDPLVSARSNAPKLLSYVGAYLTWPIALFALMSAFLLRQTFAVWLLVAGSILPLVAQVFTLEAMFPTRYPFAHFSIWLVVAAVGLTGLRLKPATLGLAALVLVGPLAYRDVRILNEPSRALHPTDIHGFLGDSSFVGHGALDAVARLQQEARSGPFILLTDPYWGPPADVFFAYLNGRNGIQVHEAWWLQLDGPRPIMPNGRVDLIRSHYERVQAGQLDFRQAPRVFYATDTHQTPRQAVRARQPSAQLIASFSEPNSPHSIDIYRLR